MSATDLSAFETQVQSFISEHLTPDLSRAAALGFGISRADGERWHQAVYKQVDRSRLAGGTWWYRLDSAPETSVFQCHSAGRGAHDYAFRHRHGWPGHLHLWHR